MTQQPAGPATRAAPGWLLLAGCLVFVVTLAAYLYAEGQHIESSPILWLGGAIVGALFLGGQLTNLGGRVDTVADLARKVDGQTNGGLDTRIAAAVAAELARRDAVKASGMLAHQAGLSVAQAAPYAPTRVVPPAGSPDQT